MADNKTETTAPGTAKAKKEKKTAEGTDDTHVHHNQRVKTKSKWTLDRCKKFARRFTSEAAWAEGSPSSYKSAQARGWIAQCMTQMKPVTKPTKTIRHAG